jgi:beta-glucosidase
MISQVEAANPNTAVYLETTGPVDTGSFAATTPALVWSSYDGQRQGDALADVLLGKVDPSGHLPFTWYANDAQLPPITDYAIRPSADNPGRTYMYFTGRPTYPFGYGESYTRFAFSTLHLLARSVDAEGTVAATSTVTNAGSRPGTTVAQLYATTPFATSRAQRPAKRLVAFDRVTLQPGAQRKLTFRFPASQLAFFDQAKHRFAIGHGTYGLQLATSSADVRRTAPVTLTGSLGSVPTAVTAQPAERRDAAHDIAQRVAYDVNSVIDPHLTVATDDEALHGYVTKGESTPLPNGLVVKYTSNRPGVVAVKGQTLRTTHAGLATVSVSASYGGHTVRTSFPVNVAPLHVTSDENAAFTTGSPGSFAITTATTQSPTAAEVPSLSVVGRLPDGLSFADNGDGTGTISGTPTTDGTYPVTVVAHNATSPDASQPLTISVSSS